MTIETYTVFGPAGPVLVPVEPITKRKGKAPKVTTVPAPEAPAMPKAGKGKTPKAPKAKPEGKTKAEAKAEGVVVLDDAMKAAEANVVAKATAVEHGARDAAFAIAEANATGVHRAYGLSLAAWVVKCLTAAGLAKATVYYLKDVGTSAAALGKDRASLFPMEGLRAIASAAKGDAKAIRELAAAAQGGNESAKPTLEACRNAAKGVESEPMTEALMIDRLMKVAVRLSGDDLLVAADLLAKAASKAKAMEAKRQEVEAKAAKGKGVKA